MPTFPCNSTPSGDNLFSLWEGTVFRVSLLGDSVFKNILFLSFLILLLFRWGLSALAGLTHCVAWAGLVQRKPGPRLFFTLVEHLKAISLRFCSRF